MKKYKPTLRFALIICLVIGLIILPFFLNNISIQKNITGEIKAIQIYNIGFIIMSNIILIPFLIIPFSILFSLIRYLVKGCKSLITNFNKNIFLTIKRFRFPSKEIYSIEILSLILLPLSIFLIYYYPFKSTYEIVSSPSTKLLLSTHYIYPKKPRVESYALESVDSLLIHLWDPSFSSADEGTPTGQVFLYYKKEIEETTPFTEQTIIREIHSRKELFTGSQDLAEKLGNLLYEIIGSTTIINKVEGKIPRPVSHKVLPAK